MRKYIFLCIFAIVVVLSGCSGSKDKYNFTPRQNDTYISKDGTVLLDYKTNENGKLVRFNIDRLITIEEMILYNPNIDYDLVVEGFDGDIFVKPSVGCFMPKDFKVPVNIEIGSVKYKYYDAYCKYAEVDRNNEFKVSSFAREYELKSTILEDKSVDVNIVIYDENAIETYTEILTLPHTLRTIGVYGIIFGDDYNGPSRYYLSFINDMKLFEQFVLRYQESEKAINEILGDTENINILNFDELDQIVSLIDDFEELYENEITAIEELEGEIGKNKSIDDVDEEPVEEQPSGNDTAWKKWYFEY